MCRSAPNNSINDMPVYNIYGRYVNYKIIQTILHSIIYFCVQIISMSRQIDQSKIYSAKIYPEHESFLWARVEAMRKTNPKITKTEVLYNILHEYIKNNYPVDAAALPEKKADRRRAEYR